MIEETQNHFSREVETVEDILDELVRLADFPPLLREGLNLAFKAGLHKKLESSEKSQPIIKPGKILDGLIGKKRSFWEEYGKQKEDVNLSSDPGIERMIENHLERSKQNREGSPVDYFFSLNNRKVKLCFPWIFIPLEAVQWSIARPDAWKAWWSFEDVKRRAMQIFNYMFSSLYLGYIFVNGSEILRFTRMSYWSGTSFAIVTSTSPGTMLIEERKGRTDGLSKIIEVDMNRDGKVSYFDTLEKTDVKTFYLFDPVGVWEAAQAVKTNSPETPALISALLAPFLKNPRFNLYASDLSKGDAALLKNITFLSSEGVFIREKWIENRSQNENKAIWLGKPFVELVFNKVFGNGAWDKDDWMRIPRLLKEKLNAKLLKEHFETYDSLYYYNLAYKIQEGIEKSKNEKDVLKRFGIPKRRKSGTRKA